MSVCLTAAKVQGRLCKNGRCLLPSLLVVMTACLSPTAIYANERRAITANDLAGIRDIGGHYSGALSVSPNGDLVAFQLQTPDFEGRTYTLSWYVAETKPGGDIWAVGDGGEVILDPELRSIPSGNRPPVNALWSRDGEWINYLKRTDGQSQIWRSKWDGSTQEQLTNIAHNVITNAFNHEAQPSFKFNNDRSVLFFNVAAEPPAVEELLREESNRGFLFDDRFRPGKETVPVVRTCGISAPGKSDEVSIERDCEPQLWIYLFEQRLARTATPEEAVAYRSLKDAVPQGLKERNVRSFHLSNDASRWCWLENERPEQYPGSGAPVRLFASTDGQEFRCNADECEAHGSAIEGVWFRPNSDEVIFQRADGSNESMTGLYAWTPGAEDVRTMLKTDDELEDCEALEDRMICLRETWTHPRTIISLNLESGEMSTIYDPNPELDEIHFSNIEKLEWQNDFGEATHGHLVYPLNYVTGQRYPLVITTYRSRGFLRGGIGDEYPIHLLAAQGFMVLSHDMPRSLERFASLADPVRAEWGNLHERRSTLSAQKKMLEIVNRRGLIDLKRIAITGLSDGADQVRFALIHSDDFTTGIASSALDYRAHYYLNSEHWRRYWEMRLGGSPDEDKKGHWRALSLGLNANSVNEPYLANVSDDELLFSVESVSRLQEAGVAVEMYVFPGEHHIKWQPQHRLAIYRRNVQWLKFWLMGEEVDDPVDPDQYVRWRKMREAQCGRLKDQDNVPWYCRH